MNELYTQKNCGYFIYLHIRSYHIWAKQKAMYHHISGCLLQTFWWFNHPWSMKIPPKKYYHHPRRGRHAARCEKSSLSRRTHKPRSDMSRNNGRTDPEIIGLFAEGDGDGNPNWAYHMFEQTLCHCRIPDMHILYYFIIFCNAGNTESLECHRGSRVDVKTVQLSWGERPWFLPELRLGCVRGRSAPNISLAETISNWNLLQGHRMRRMKRGHFWSPWILSFAQKRWLATLFKKNTGRTRLARNRIVNVLRRLISLRRRTVLWHWYIWALVCCKKNV